MSKNQISKAESIKRTKLLVELIICAGIICGGVFVVRGALKRSQTIEKTDVGGSIIDVTEPATQPSDVPDPNQVIYESYMADTKDKFKGDLILVNEDHQYFGGGEDLVNIIDENNKRDIAFFSALADPNTDEDDDLILSKVYEPMEIMIEDFYNLYYNGTLIIYGAYRSTERQQQILDEKGDEIAAKPGYSEHETGYAFDFSETENYDYQGTGDFAWLNENCYKYGFIVRYAEDKTDITKIAAEPWHFRYVGIPHAYYMMKNNLCLEEYTDLIREKYPYEGEHLTFTDDENRNFEIYFVASDDGSDKTTIPVPVGKIYNISGNNVDGFVITVYEDGTPDITSKIQPDSNDNDDNDDDSDDNYDNNDDSDDMNNDDSDEY